MPRSPPAFSSTSLCVSIPIAFLMALATDPNVTGAIQVALEPRFIPYYVIAIGLITEIARRRTISRVP